MDVSNAFKAALVAGAICLGVGIKYFVVSPVVDIPVEKIAEQVVKQETGVDIDFTKTST